MTGRDRILERIKTNKPGGNPCPGSFGHYQKYLDQKELIDHFRENLQKAGAEIYELSAGEETGPYLSLKFSGSVNLMDPAIRKRYENHVPYEDLEKTEVLVAGGQFGVAENGAVWLDETNFINRLLPFITRQLVLVIDKTRIVGTMHEAYQKTDLSDSGFGVFISGPSKTADIEQSLVYGAHGAKELLVLIY